MKLAFMTLGCPNWDLDTICARGREYGYDGVDFRGYLHEIDITKLPEFTTDVQRTHRQLQDAGLEVSGISSSIQVCVEEKQIEYMEEARRTITTAHALGCSNVRIYGGGHLSHHTHAELAKIGSAYIAKILDLDGARDIHWLFETHDNWTKARDCRLLLDAIPDPAFGVLWDMAYTYRIGGESPSAALQAFGGRVGNTHIKDAVHDPQHPLAMGDGWRYVLPGTGTLPLAESIRLLIASGYTGWLQCEHEKRWIPTLVEPEVIFPAFVQWIKTVLA